MSGEYGNVYNSTHNYNVATNPAEQNKPHNLINPANPLSPFNVMHNTTMERKVETTSEIAVSYDNQILALRKEVRHYQDKEGAYGIIVFVLIITIIINFMRKRNNVSQ